MIGASTLEARAQFLATTRLGVLVTLRADGTPIAVPVWYEWTGRTVEMFAARNSPKVTRLTHNPTASLLVTNQVGEPECWVAFDGVVEIAQSGGIELAERLAARYWDLADPERLAALVSWQQHPEAFCLLRLTPNRIRTGS